ncbi:hypothetical protein NLO85_27465, partial [Pseudomonas savastanoi]|nr:hypothetical protein [Pseudomonas savastanoi]
KTERKTRSTHTASDRFQKNSAMCLANYGLPPLRGKLIGASLEFDETCANRTSDTLLGAVILDDNSTHFIKHLVTG